MAAAGLPEDAVVSCDYLEYNGERIDFYDNPDENFDDLEGSCIFGKTLVNLGANKREISAGEGQNIKSLLKRLKIEVSPEKAEFFKDIQYWQDHNYSWSDAIEMAETGIPCGSEHV